MRNDTVTVDRNLYLTVLVLAAVGMVTFAAAYIYALHWGVHYVLEKIVYAPR